MLTPKQKAFCEYYIGEARHNATQAAIKAGYSSKTAYSVGCENLRKPEIKKYIKSIENKASTSRIASATDILEFWTTVMQGDKNSLKDRMTASKMLADYRGIFDGRGDESKDETNGRIVIIDDVPQQGEEYVNQENNT